MIVLLSIFFFLLGFVLRDILNYIYNINKKIKQADEIIKKEQERLRFKQKYDISLEDEKEENSEEK